MKRFGILALGLSLIWGAGHAQTLLNELPNLRPVNPAHVFDKEISVGSPSSMKTSALVTDTLSDYFFTTEGTCTPFGPIPLQLQTGQMIGYLGGPFFDATILTNPPTPGMVLTEQARFFDLVPPTGTVANAISMIGAFVLFSNESSIINDPDLFRLKVYDFSFFNPPNELSYALLGQQTFELSDNIPELAQNLSNIYDDGFRIDFDSPLNLQTPMGLPTILGVSFTSWGAEIDDSLKFFFNASIDPSTGTACAEKNWKIFLDTPSGPSLGDMPNIPASATENLNTIGPLIFPILTWDLTTANDKVVADQFAVYPNPAHRAVTVRTQLGNRTAQAELLDLTGRIVRTQTLQFASDEASMNLDGMAAGVYTLRLASEGNTQHIKLTVR